MVAPIHELIDGVRQLLEGVAVHNDEGDSSAEDENEPGQWTDDGDIVFVFKTPSGDQQSTHTLDSQLYQQILKSQGCQLLEVYNSNALYLSNNKEMKRKVRVHMKRTNAYASIEKLRVEDPTCVRRHLDAIVHQVTTLLHDLRSSHCLNDAQFGQMTTVQPEVRMDYLFYAPDVHQVSLVE